MFARPAAPSPGLGGPSLCGLACGMARRLPFSSGNSGEGTRDGRSGKLTGNHLACMLRSEDRGQGSGKAREGAGLGKGGRVSMLTSQKLRDAGEVVSEASRAGIWTVCPTTTMRHVTRMTERRDWLAGFLWYENKSWVTKSWQGSWTPRLAPAGRGRMRRWFPGFPTRAACPWGALAPACRATPVARTQGR